ncbi:sensor histidine kinase [Paenibacillus sp. UNC451MF]|uniref:sensor histidine kinase n=1 Tax=Paenibacillus sp. UNC451MF TaxID=1449063 RepID=UPI0004903DB0|nr:HAMP domain-containing sensor histidine kinase [Paenibacillus sp. UNC451MF]
MDAEPLLKLLRDKKPLVIERWQQLMSERLTRNYNLSNMTRKGDIYFDYLTDLHIETDSHPILQKVPEWCQRFEELQLQIIDIIQCSHMWRRSLVEVCGDSLSIKLFQAICLRIDEFEAVLTESYWQTTVASIKEKDMAIHELHDDRMNLIGKMAASMAHEIRNPLTSIKGFVQLLRSNIRTLPVEKTDAYLEFIEAECNNMHMQVTGFLSFSKRPMVEEEMAPISVKQILDYNLSLLRPRLINENVHLNVNILDNMMLRVQKLAIQQVLNNLINNGIDALSDAKYDKKINITAFEDHLKAYIHITNNGPEIPTELAKSLFTPFVTNKTNGTGLGLTICKQIMSKNDGDISFKSTEEETVFMLSFPKSAS